MPQKVKGKRILKNGVTAGYVRQKDGSWRFRFLKDSKKKNIIKKGGRIGYNARTFQWYGYNLTGKDEANFLNQLGVKYSSAYGGQDYNDIPGYSNFWRYPNRRIADYNLSLEEAIDYSGYDSRNVMRELVNIIINRINQLQNGPGLRGHLHQIKCMVAAFNYFHNLGYVNSADTQRLRTAIQDKARFLRIGEDNFFFP